MLEDERRVLMWDGFFKNKGGVYNSPYFMLSDALKKKKIDYVTKFNDFIDSYVEDGALCGRNKESFSGVSQDFSFWHYHCGNKNNDYNEPYLQYYNNKSCMDNYKIIKEKKCLSCTLLTENHNGRTSSEIIHYVKFNNSKTIGIIGYAEKHLPFLKLESPIIQEILSLNIQNFIAI